jgi:hypothetical protein
LSFCPAKVASVDDNLAIFCRIGLVNARFRLVDKPLSDFLGKHPA